MPKFRKHISGQWDAVPKGTLYQYKLDNGIILNWYDSKNGTLRVEVLKGSREQSVHELHQRLQEELPKSGWRSKESITKAVQAMIPDEDIEITANPSISVRIQDRGNNGIQCSFWGSNLAPKMIITYYPTNKHLYHDPNTPKLESVWKTLTEFTQILVFHESDQFKQGLKQLFPRHEEEFVTTSSSPAPTPSIVPEHVMPMKDIHGHTKSNHAVSMTVNNQTLLGFNWSHMWPNSHTLRKAAIQKERCQKEFLDDWSTTIQHMHCNTNGIRNPRKKHLLAQAPTGLGKTISALVPALEWIKQSPNTNKVFFLVGREEQHRNPIAELQTLAPLFFQQTQTNLHVVDVLGKSKLCIDPHSKTLSNCCLSSKENASWGQIPNLASGREVQKYIQAHHPDDCPYHVLQGLMKSAHVVVCDYWWFFSNQAQKSDILSYLGIQRSNVTLIVDEAHNLPLRVRDEYDLLLSKQNLIDIANTCGHVSQKCFDILIKIYDYLSKSTSGRNSSEIRALLQKHELTILEECSQFEEESEWMEMSVLTKIYWNITQEDGRIVAYSTENIDGELCIAFSQIDIQQTLRRGYQHIHASLSMSGTLAAPTDSDAELRYQLALFGLEDNIAIAQCYGSPFLLKNQRWLFVDKTYGTRKERNKYIKKYIQDIEDTVQVTKRGTLVFCNSYAFLEGIAAGLSPEIQQYTIVEKSSTERQSLEDIQQQILQNIQQYGHALLLAVYQGQIAEGANFKDNLIQSIICLSLPIEYPNLVHQYLQEHYKKLFANIASDLNASQNILEEKTKEYSLYRQSLSLILQASGRGIRHMDDRCCIILHDKRYEQYLWRKFFKTTPFNASLPKENIQRFWNAPSVMGSEDNTWDNAIIRIGGPSNAGDSNEN